MMVLDDAKPLSSTVFIIVLKYRRRVKIIGSVPMGSVMSETELADFLTSSKTNLQLATGDS